MRDLQMEYLDALVKQFAAGEISVQPEAVKHTRREMIDYLRENVAELEVAVRSMTPEQLAYRLPGSPSGADASGDEEHFDTSQIATHVAGGLTFHWWGIARALGHERPSFTRPPEGAKVTGTQGKVMGRGGWSGVSAQELATLMRETADRFLDYLDSLPDEIDEKTTTRFGSHPAGDLTAHGWLFLAAIHPAMHLHQLRIMQSQADYPA